MLTCGNNRGKCGSIRQCICNEPSEVIKRLCPNMGVGTWGDVPGHSRKTRHAQMNAWVQGAAFNGNMDINSV